MLPRCLAIISTVFLLTLLSSCMEQYNPRPDWAKFERERQIGNASIPVLLANGELPPEDGKGPSKPADEIYASVCAACHGKEGKGDGQPGLNPPPRNFTEQAWQDQAQDEDIAKAIRGGGIAVGKSALMPAFNEDQIPEDRLEEMVKLIRGFRG